MDSAKEIRKAKITLKGKVCSQFRIREVQTTLKTYGERENEKFFLFISPVRVV